MVDRDLLEYATPTEIKYFRAIEKHGSGAAAARALGVGKSSINKCMQRLRRRAAKKNPALHVNTAPEGYKLRGVSTQRRVLDEHGNECLQWVKTAPDRLEQRRELLREAIEDITAAGKGRLAPLKPPTTTDGDLLAIYPNADPHIGLLAYAEEAGEDFDLKKCEQVMADTVDRLVASVPPAQRALLISLGDYFHADGPSLTTTKGTPQDVDGKWHRIAPVGVKITRRMIDRLLQKHTEVTAWIIGGNHDANQAIWLAIALEAAYEKEPRVSVAVSPAPYQVLEFGRCLIGAAHGHRAKLDSLPGFLAAEWAEEWGRTEHRIWYTGHLHHDSMREHAGCLVETLRSVTSRDAWTYASAYRSGRDLKCDVWHRDSGRIARLIQRAA